MSKINALGLDTAKTKKTASRLNDLLAHYSIFYQNVRGYHWNIQGDKFFELHVKFEELYTNLQLKIDEIAERILTLMCNPEHNYSAYRKLSAIKESKMVTDGLLAVKDVLHAFSVLLKLQRDLLSISEEANDEGTNALMSDYIREQEKLVWMYSAYLKK